MNKSGAFGTILRIFQRAIGGETHTFSLTKVTMKPANGVGPGATRGAKEAKNEVTTKVMLLPFPNSKWGLDRHTATARNLIYRRKKVFVRKGHEHTYSLPRTIADQATHLEISLTF